MTQIQTATLDAGADMQPSDEQIVEAGYMHTVETDEPLFTFDRKELIAMVRELLSASKPAVLQDNEQDPDVELCRHCGEPTDRPGFCVCNGAKYERKHRTASPAAPAQSGEPVATVRDNPGRHWHSHRGDAPARSRNATLSCPQPAQTERALTDEQIRRAADASGLGA